MISKEKCTDNATAYNLIYEEAKISPPEVVVDKSRRRSGDAIMNKLNEAEIRRKVIIIIIVVVVVVVVVPSLHVLLYTNLRIS